ncbi:hypothetical protein ABZ705_30750 [Streptomyces sp. NPDC006984]|uniref:hypothetical protein n=1 Tax=Streptomyces sp. NPDC006984 TaxID=3155463 RepID=UPI003408D3DF
MTTQLPDPLAALTVAVTHGLTEEQADTALALAAHYLVESWEGHATALGLNPYDMDAMEAWGRGLSPAIRDGFLEHAVDAVRLGDETAAAQAPRHLRPRRPRVMHTCRPRVRIH